MKNPLFLLLIYLIGFQKPVFSQTPELVIQSGHSDVINKILYAPNGKHLITCSDDYTIKIWEIASGKEMRTLLGHSKPVNEIAISPDGSQLVSVSDDRKIIIWSFPEGRQIKTIKEHKNKVLTVDYSPTGEYFATGSKDKTVRLYNTKSFKGKEIYAFKSEVNKVKFLNDGNHLYTETDALLSKNAFFTIPQGKMVTWVPGGGATAIDIDKENKRFLAARDFGDQPTVNIIKDWKKIKDWRKSKESLWKSIIPYNFQDTTGKYNVLKVKGKENFNVNNTAVKEGGTVASKYSVKAFFSKDANEDIVAGNHLGDLLFWRYDDINYFPRTVNPYAKLNEKVGNMYVTPYKVIDAHNAPILDVVSSSDGQYILTSADNGEMKLWDVARESNVQTFINGLVKPIFSVAFDANSHLALISTGLNDRYLVDLGTMDIIEKFQLDYAIEKICFSANRKLALVAFYNSSYFHLMDFETKKLLKTFKGHLGEITSLTFSADEKLAISTATEGKKISWSLSTGEKVSSELTDFNPLKTSSGQAEIAYNKLSATLTANGKSVELPHYNRVTSFGFTPDERFAYTASPGGSLNFWNPATGQLEAKIMMTKAEELIGISADYYFMASPAALKSIAFRYQDKMYPFEQFDLRYNRPDLFLKKLGYADQSLISAFEKAYQKRKRQLGNQITESSLFDAPEIEVDYLQIAKSTNLRDITFQVNVRSENIPLQKLIIKVNGVPDQQIALSGNAATKQVTVSLSVGLNQIEVASENDGGTRSLIQNFEVKFIPKERVKRNLYLVTIGVSEYANSDFNLNYAEKDAIDVADLFKKQSANAYQQVFHFNLLNEAVTNEAIKALKDKLEKAKVDDQVVFFFAGHGLLSTDLDYYLATYDTNFEKPETAGFAYEAVAELLSASPARNKLVMIDACHSGEVDKESVEISPEAESAPSANLVFRGFQRISNKKLGMGNTFQLMRSTFSDLRDNTGTIVISSAGGAEYALESDRWSNGVFTFFLKDGLLSKKADLNNDGYIYAGELQQYVAARVSEATGGKQQPTMRVANLKNDILIWQ
ncbi:MAG: caspase family protein [Bacteroidota bacterium]